LLLDLLQNGDKRERLGDATKARIHNEFSVQQMAEGYLRVIRGDWGRSRLPKPAQPAAGLRNQVIEPGDEASASVMLERALWPFILVRRISGPVLNAIPAGIPVLVRVSAGLAAVYCATIIYGAAAGHALPTATIFRMPYSDVITRFEASLPRIMLLVALAGTGLGWLAKAGLVDEAQLRHGEISGMRSLRRHGLLIFVAAFLLALTCSSSWNGTLVQNYEDSILGLVPLSDAHAYYVSPLQQALTGHWSAFASRRPVAAAFRELLMMAGGFSDTGTLLVQSILVAAGLFLAALTVTFWRGLWCGIAFSALVYLVARPFLSTVLTEPLGLFWGLLSVAFTVEAMRSKSVFHAFLALTALTFAEVVRMGSMFTIPAFALWIAISFGSGLKQRVKLAAAGGALIGIVMAIQIICASAYGSRDSVTGGNFAFTLCGLAVGHNWTACSHQFGPELHQLASDREQSAFLLSKALQLVQQNPYPMLGRMFDNIHDLLSGVPQFLLYGFNSYHRPLQELLFVLLVAPGLFLAWRNRQRGEASFWILFFASLLGSVALIFADDGWRVMHSTWPFVALFFSLGFAHPKQNRSGTSTEPQISARAGTLLVAILVGSIVIAPAVAHLWFGTELDRTAKAGKLDSAESALLEGRSVTGILVVADQAPLPDSVPAIHASQFVRLAKDLELEQAFGKFVDRAIAHVPFALIAAARIDKPDDNHQPWNFLVAPPQILTEARARAWLVDFDKLTDGPRRTIVPQIRSVRALRNALGRQPGG